MMQLQESRLLQQPNPQAVRCEDWLRHSSPCVPHQPAWTTINRRQRKPTIRGSELQPYGNKPTLLRAIQYDHTNYEVRAFRCNRSLAWLLSCAICAEYCLALRSVFISSAISSKSSSTAGNANNVHRQHYTKPWSSGNAIIRTSLTSHGWMVSSNIRLQWIQRV